MIRVTAPARLHFGLLSLPIEGEDFWPDRQGQPSLPVRRFGGVGLMIEDPALRLRVEPAAEWSATGSLAERALAFARRFAAVSEKPLPPQRVVIESAPPEHCGLGSGTQLALAVARGLASASLPDLGAAELARRVGRGVRSALGVHGFAQGGFLVEAGKRAEQELSPLVLRLPFPETWRLVVALPPGEPGQHGDREREAFQMLRARSMPAGSSAALCRLVLLGLLPALIEGDVETFGEALYDFNARVGEAFAPVQGGTYANRRVAEVVDFVRRQGVRGVGQSSWGPTVFAVLDDAERANDLVRRLHDGPLGEVPIWVTRGCNRGAAVD
jgi:beta-RFAP synthase